MTPKEKQRELIVEIMKADEQSGIYPTMKQTAVDWLITQLWDTPKDKLTWYKIAGDAKDMEKEQIIRARQDGLDNGFSNGSWDSNLYYKETYE
jgi:hypothetical protein